MALGYARNESPKQAKAKVVQLARLLQKKVNTAFFSLRDAKKVTLAQIFPANIDAAKLIGSALQRANQAKIDDLITEGTLKEVCNDNFG